MATEIQTKFKDLVVAANTEQYYVHIFDRVMAKRGMTLEGVSNDQYDDKSLILTAHEVWEALPDSPSIRRGPFFALCNIAERMFG